VKNFFLKVSGNQRKWPQLPIPWTSSQIVYADVGARGGPPQNWLRSGSNVVYVCFEPDPEEARNLERDFTQNDIYKAIVINKALGSETGTQTLHLTKFRPSSSILEPNHELLKNMADGDFYEVEKKIPVSITPLDSVADSAGITVDFLKIDVQGYELEVLKGANKMLDHVMACELEVSFIEIYKNQPFFADLDQFMRSRGFFLADLERFWWRSKGMPLQIQERGILSYGNAFYLKTSVMTPNCRDVALKSSLICSAMGMDELSWEIVASAAASGLLNSSERESLESWLRKRRSQTFFWFKMAEKLRHLPGRRTVARWLSLWARALEGNSHTGSDAQSWNRKTSW
jgi:FkbM family methyltransferase